MTWFKKEKKTIEVEAVIKPEWGKPFIGYFKNSNYFIGYITRNKEKLEILIGDFNGGLDTRLNEEFCSWEDVVDEIDCWMYLPSKN